MDALDQLAAINRLAGRDHGATLPDDIRDWMPKPATIPEPGGLHGFDSTAAPEVFGTWLAMARKWGAPDSSDIAKADDTRALARRYTGMLRSPKTWPGVYSAWEQLMVLFREGSTLMPVPWGWWRVKNAPHLSVYGVYSAKVLALPWQRGKFREEEGHRFVERTRLFPKVSDELATLQRTARATGLYDLAKWGALREDESVQRSKILMRVQQAWTHSNLALWLTDGDELVDAIRLKTVAVAQLQ